MSEVSKKQSLGRWLRRHSLTLVAALGGATGVAYAVGWHTATTSAAPVASPAIAIAVPPITVKKPDLPRDNVQDTVQIALLLDTSGSMDGLINQARAQLWKMVDQMGRMNRVVDGKLRTVRIELALYEYGNDTLSERAGYIRQVTAFTTGLDKVSEQLQALFTNGGSEYVGEAIQQSVLGLKWSEDPAALKFVFVAGNEEFDQGPVTATRAMALAAKQDITVQLIHCGGSDPTWAAAAKLAKSDLLTIDQDYVAQHVPSPQDADILRLSNEMNSTYLAYGEEGEVASMRQQSADTSSAQMSAKVAIERANLKSTANYRNDNWDVVDALNNNDKFFDQTADDKLPTELRGKTLAEKQQIVAAKAATRAELQAKIAKLESERQAFLANTAKTAEAQSLETELMKTTKRIATEKGYKF